MTPPQTAPQRLTDKEWQDLQPPLVNDVASYLPMGGPGKAALIALFEEARRARDSEAALARDMACLLDGIEAERLHVLQADRAKRYVARYEEIRSTGNVPKLPSVREAEALLRAEKAETLAAAEKKRADDAEAQVATLKERCAELGEALDSELDEVYTATTEEAFRVIRALARYALAFRRSRDAAEAREAKALDALRLAWDPHAYSCCGRQGETCTCGAAELLR